MIYLSEILPSCPLVESVIPACFWRESRRDFVGQKPSGALDGGGPLVFTGLTISPDDGFNFDLQSTNVALSLAAKVFQLPEKRG